MILKHWVSGLSGLLLNVILDKQTTLLPSAFILINLGFTGYYFWFLSSIQHIIQIRDYT